MISTRPLSLEQMNNIRRLVEALDGRMRLFIHGKIKAEDFIFDPRYGKRGLFKLIALGDNDESSPFFNTRSKLKIVEDGSVYCFDGMTPFDKCVGLFGDQFMQLVERDTALTNKLWSFADFYDIPVEYFYTVATLEVVRQVATAEEFTAMCRDLPNFDHYGNKVVGSEIMAIYQIIQHNVHGKSIVRPTEQPAAPLHEPTAPTVPPESCNDIVGELSAFVAYVDTLSPKAKEYLKLSAAQTRAKAVIKLLG